MAGSESSDSGAEPPPSKFEIKTLAINISIKIPRRKLTLIIITCLLNVLLWSSLVCLAASIYQVASDLKDTTNIVPVVLTSTSALVTIAYTFFHTIISLKQRIWKHQQRHPSAIKKTSYVGIRIVVSLCVLWLLTTGWNMIIVARRPLCLSNAPELQRWEYGTTCQMSRVGMAFAMIALIASCTLFGVLGAVRRPFEAHLFKHGYQAPTDVHSTPSVSRRPSPARPVSYASEKPQGRRRSASTQRSNHSNMSNADVDTLYLNPSPPGSTIHAPSPVRSLGIGIFTSNFTPPPIPSAYVAPPRTSSLESPPSIFQPSVNYNSLTRPPRISGLVATSGFVPLSVPVQYSASAWRAVHPASPPSIRPKSRTHPRKSSADFSYRSRYSRSSVSLTRPHRLSTATPTGSVAWSSRSGSSGPEGRDSPLSGEGGEVQRATPNEIAYAILNGTPFPGTTGQKGRKRGHMRTSSAPDATSGAHAPPHSVPSHPLDRMAMGWKPQLPVPVPALDHDAQASPPQRPMLETSSMSSLKIVKLVPSSSSMAADFMSRFSPDTSPDDDATTPGAALERDIVAAAAQQLPFRRSRSADPMRRATATGVGATNPAEAKAVMLSRMPQDLRMGKGRERGREGEREKGRAVSAQVGQGRERERGRRMTFDEVKNKPLPRIFRD